MFYGYVLWVVIIMNIDASLKFWLPGNYVNVNVNVNHIS